MAWESFRDWLVENWEWSAKQLVLTHAINPKELNLHQHPDLLWALKAEASYNEMELNEQLALIIDSFFYGEITEVRRRGKKLVIETGDENNDSEIQTKMESL